MYALEAIIAQLRSYVPYKRLYCRADRDTLWWVLTMEETKETAWACELKSLLQIFVTFPIYYAEPQIYGPNERLPACCYFQSAQRKGT